MSDKFWRRVLVSIRLWKWLKAHYNDPEVRQAFFLMMEDYEELKDICEDW